MFFRLSGVVQLESSIFFRLSGWGEAAHGLDDMQLLYSYEQYKLIFLS